MTAGRKFTYNKTDWNTPQKYVDAILKVFGEIDLDPCSNEYSIVPAYEKIILPQNGLKEKWNFRRIYVNPPYGRNTDGTTIYNWLEKCYLERENPMSNIIALIPVATNTKHWKNFVFKSDIICFLNDTRLKFRINNEENNKGSSMSCAMIYWGDDFYKKFIEIFNQYGNCVKIIKE